LSNLEDEFAFQLKAARVALPVREFRPVPGRRWRVDFSWPDRMVCLEVEGATWIAGRHTRGLGFQKDCEKYAELALQGWTVLRATKEHIRNGMALAWIERALGKQSAGKECSKSVPVPETLR
jgi:very-short-patch-repair endonuclease